MANVDIKPILEQVQIPPKLKPMYDKMVFNGKRLMFSEDMEQSLNEILDGEGELPDKLAKGVTAVMYMLWTQSNKTLPLELMIPVGFTLAVYAFDFLQKSKEPGVSKQTLGDGVQKTVESIARGFGIEEGQFEEFANQAKSKAEVDSQQGQPPPADPAAAATPPPGQPPVDPAAAQPPTGMMGG